MLNVSVSDEENFLIFCLCKHFYRSIIILTNMFYKRIRPYVLYGKFDSYHLKMMQ